MRLKDGPVKEAGVHTPLELAKQLYEGYKAFKSKGEGLNYNSYTLYALYALLDGGEGEKLYGFLPKSSLSIRTADEILRVMNIVREGKKREGLSLTDKQKGVLKLIEDYEKDLEERGLIDRPALLKEVVRILEASTDEELMLYLAYTEKPSVFLELSAMKRFSYLEKTFIDLFIKKMGLEHSEGELVILGEKAPELDLKKAYGMYNEVNYCIRDIKEHQYPLDDVGIYYTSDDYEGFLKGLFESEGLGIKFDSELVSYKDVLQLILVLIDSLKNNYSYEDLEQLVNNRGLVQKEEDKKNKDEEKQAQIELEKLEDLEEEEELDLDEIELQERVSLENEVGSENSEEAKAWSYTLKGAYYKLLRKENIGYGKKRYEDFLGRHEELGEFSTLSSEENEKMLYFKQFLWDYIHIYEPHHSAEETLNNLIDFSKKYIRKCHEKNIILTALRDYRAAMSLLGDSCKDEQLDIISELIQGIRVSSTGLKGRPRCSRISGRMIAETRYNYVIGVIELRRTLNQLKSVNLNFFMLRRCFT